VAFGFFFSSVEGFTPSSSSESVPPSLFSSSLPSSSSLSGAPNAFAGLLSKTASFIGAAKLESLGPDPPAKPLPRVDPNTLPLFNPPNPEVVAPLPNAKPEPGLSPVAPPKLVDGTVEVVVGDFAPPRAPKPDVVVLGFPPNTLGFDAPSVPNGEELVDAKDAKPELAKAEDDVCGLSLSVLPNTAGLLGSFAALASAGSVLDGAPSEPETAAS
jgi:hypothetical protein